MKIKIMFQGQPLLTIPDFRKTLQPWLEFPRRQILEIIVVILTVAVALFTTNNTRGYAITFGVLWLLLTGRGTKKELGLVWQNSKDTLWILEFAAVLVGLLWLGAFVFGSETARRLDFEAMSTKYGYLANAFLQQFVLLSYIFIRLEKLLKGGQRAVTPSALIFALCHAPNPMLMAITFVGGWLSCSMFRIARNYYTLALAHAIIGAAIATFLPGWVIKAGIGAWRWWTQ